MCDQPITAEQVIEFIREQRDALSHFHNSPTKVKLEVYGGYDFDAPRLADLEVHLYEHESYQWQSRNLDLTILLRGLP